MVMHEEHKSICSTLVCDETQGGFILLLYQHITSVYPLLERQIQLLIYSTADPKFVRGYIHSFVRFLLLNIPQKGYSRQAYLITNIWVSHVDAITMFGKQTIDLA